MPTGTTSKPSNSSNSSNSKSAPNAIELLKADHRTVEDLFEKFESGKGSASKQKIADQICKELTVHAQIEEEIFYPACERAGVEQEDLDEALVEHQSAKELIAQIEDGSPKADDLWEAKVKVLKEQIEHHVEEEEGKEGIFVQARQKKLDLDALGEQMAARKAELTATV